MFEVVEWVPSLTTHRTFVPAEMEAPRAEGEVDHPHPLHDHEAGQGPAPAGGPLVGADDSGRQPDKKEDHPAMATRMGASRNGPPSRRTPMVPGRCSESLIGRSSKWLLRAISSANRGAETLG